MLRKQTGRDPQAMEKALNADAAMGDENTDGVNGAPRKRKRKRKPKDADGTVAMAVEEAGDD